ncbi:hypothetical protein [Goodfellowiella coeruleoviolacea]|uniref:hypothetical protein n=1 Tax=Goodfellowiella coeruleoviolacea TaxID=334858 RepID=UPI0020A38EED|nr:hypothetical protein [Goodfellowiella coeruleoviolacea]
MGENEQPADARLDPDQLRRFQEFQQFQQFLRFQEAQQQNDAAAASTPGAAGGPPALPAPPGASPAAGTVPGSASLPVPAPGTAPGPGAAPVPVIDQGRWPPQPPSGPPHPPGSPRTPLWRRVLRLRLVRRLIRLAVTVLVVLLLLNWAYQYYFGEEPEEAAGGGRTETNQLLPTKPSETVRMLYDHIAQGLPDDACALFTDATKQTFATDLGAPDCPQAMRQLSAAVQRKSSYAEPVFRNDTTKVPAGTTTEISSCADLVVQGGQRLGRFTLTRQDNGGWIISGHENEPADCVGG